MGFELAGYGIHGTVDPQSLGKQVTQGCVRMANNEVEELYSIVPEGTEVAIVD
jgi:lipoprotein-anchoring transpeptidase ErfK/SrfK